MATRLKTPGRFQLSPARLLVVASLCRLCPDNLYPAAAFLLQSRPALIDSASAQPPIEQAVQWVQDHVESISAARARHENAAAEPNRAWARATLRARDFLAKARLVRWVADCNDHKRFAPSTQQVCHQWARLRSAIDVEDGAAAAPPTVGVPSRVFLCRWRRRWNLRWGGLRCRDSFTDGELLAKARLWINQNRAGQCDSGFKKGAKN